MKMNQNQQEQQKIIPEQNNWRFRNIAIMYLDIVLRSLIAFLCIGVLFTIILVGYFHLSYVYVLLVVFITSVLLTPFLSKIKLGAKVFDGYVNFLEKYLHITFYEKIK